MLTEDSVLGGRLRLRQPRAGHRVGHDAILLAAACPARAGDSVVDLGSGIGAAGLAVAARVEGVDVWLVEIDPALAALAADNVRLNRLEARVCAVALDVSAPAREFAAAGLRPDSVTRVLMNPPFNDPVTQRPSPDSVRRRAHSAPRAELAAWVRTAARLLRARGTLTLIWRADGLGDALAALAPAFGSLVMLPVYPKPSAPAIRVLIHAAKAGRGPLVLLPGLTLNDEGGRPTAEAEAVLRGGAPLLLGKS